MTPAAHRPRWLERHWRPAIMLALLALAFASGWAIHASYRRALEHVHDSQLAACRRGNVLRDRLQVNVRVLDRLLTEAARARTVAAAHEENSRLAAANLEAADAYRRLRRDTRPVGRVDCARVVPRP